MELLKSSEIHMLSRLSGQVSYGRLRMGILYSVIFPLSGSIDAIWPAAHSENQTMPFESTPMRRALLPGVGDGYSVKLSVTGSNFTTMLLMCPADQMFPFGSTAIP